MSSRKVDLRSPEKHSEVSKDQRSRHKPRDRSRSPANRSSGGRDEESRRRRREERSSPKRARPSSEQSPTGRERNRDGAERNKDASERSTEQERERTRHTAQKTGDTTADRTDLPRDVERERREDSAHRTRDNIVERSSGVANRTDRTREVVEGASASGVLKRSRDVGDVSREHRDEAEREGESRRDEGRRRKREQRIEEDKEAQKCSFGGDEGSEEDDKEEPNFGLSGKLTAETNTYKGVVIKYSEPDEARQPSTRWRLYQFKAEETLPTLFIHRQSAYLIGRDRRVVDIPVDHPSCSSQHAVLQYRLVQFEKKDGSIGKRVRPYIIDLESTNGTYINNQRIDPARYVELKEKDMIKFGFSSREYVILHENTKDEIL